MYLSRRICNKQKRTKVISSCLSGKSYYASKRGLPKSERQIKAMAAGPEYPTGQRSRHSSPSAVTPRTWRRAAVHSIQYTRKEGA